MIEEDHHNPNAREFTDKSSSENIDNLVKMSKVKIQNSHAAKKALEVKKLGLFDFFH